MYFCIAVFFTLAHAASNLKSLNHETIYKKSDGSTKYSREKNSDPQNTHERKFRIHILDPQNTHEKKFWAHEIVTRKNFGPTKYPQSHGGAMTLDPQEPRWHMTHEI